MLETFEFERIDQVSPFLGAAVDAFGGNKNKASITKVLAKFFELNINLKRKLTKPRWIENKFLGLAIMIHEFKVTEKKLF